MKKYDTILWDVDGTLLDFLESQKYAITRTFQSHGIAIDEEIVCAYSEINDSYWKRLERREITKTEVLRGRFITLFQELTENGRLAHKRVDAGLLSQIDVNSFQSEYQRLLGSVYYYLDDSLNVCKRLKAQGYQQFIITNGVTSTQQNKLMLAGFYDVMDDVFISEQIGYDKPDIRFFEGCFEKMSEKGFDTDLSRMLVIGDSQTSDMQGARNTGIDCCLYLGASLHNQESEYKTHSVAPETVAKSENVDYVLYDLRNVEDILCHYPVKK